MGNDTAVIYQKGLEFYQFLYGGCASVFWAAAKEVQLPMQCDLINAPGDAN
jgi:hypothetical protein